MGPGCKSGSALPPSFASTSDALLVGETFAAFINYPKLELNSDGALRRRVEVR